MIVAIIPLKDGHEFTKEVLEGLVKQTVSISVVCISRPSGYMTMCRNLATEEALKQYREHDFFLLLNRDVILEKEDSVEQMIKFLKINEEYGAVALDTRGHKKEVLVGEKNHFDIACMVVRRYVLEKVKFDNNIGCNCISFCQNIKKLPEYNKVKYYVE